MPETNTSTTTPSMTTLLGILSADHGATVADLAKRGRLGRSTAAKVLTVLEAQGLARRQPAEHTGNRAAPDLWFATTPHAPAQAERAGVSSAPVPENPATADEVPDAETSAAQHGEARDEETGEAEGLDADPEPATAPDAEVEPDPADPAECAETVDSPQPAALAADSADGATATGAAAPADADTPAVIAPHAARAEAVTPTRLAKGGLRALVVDYLTAHPNEETTASKIGKSLERSSGAVANALDTLVKSGQAELTCEKPRTFRHRAPQTSN